jgi:hypothetical protein
VKLAGRANTKKPHPEINPGAAARIFFRRKYAYEIITV